MKTIIMSAFLTAMLVSSSWGSMPQTATDQGRYQIVNPTPAGGMNILLLDTKTGRIWRMVKDSKDREFWEELPVIMVDNPAMIMYNRTLRDEYLADHPEVKFTESK